MIYVSEEQLQQVEYLLEQSRQGHHVLFSVNTVREAFRDETDSIAEEDAYEVEHHIERLIELDSIEKKQTYLKKVDSQTQHQIIRTYFNIVENNLFEEIQETH